jgi:DNA polymerase III delta prime subunit
MNGIKNADMKSWMSSAFGSTEVEPKKLRAPRSAAKPSSDPRPTVQLPPAKRAVTSSSINKLLLAEKYAPKHRAELVVNKAKVEQLSGILDSLLDKQAGSIIIMEGPAGCGKQTTLKLLCKEKNAEIVEWSQPNTALGRFDNNNDMEYTEDAESHDWRSNPYESQSKVFANFLFKTSRYSSQIFCDDESKSGKKIIFFKDIPMFAFRDTKAFQKILSNFMAYSKSPMVFSLSNSPGMSKEFNPIKIFTADFRRELGAVEVAFNPIASTYVSKHLEKIVKQEAGFSDKLDKDFIAEVCLISDGDLRQALNILELAQYNPKVGVENSSNLKRPLTVAKTSGRGAKTVGKQKHTTRQEASENTLVQKKDANFSLFRGLGN